MPTLLLTVRETADELRLSERTVIRLIDTGELPSLLIGNRRRIERATLEAWLVRQREQQLAAVPSRTQTNGTRPDDLLAIRKYQRPMRRNIRYSKSQS